MERFKYGVHNRVHISRLLVFEPWVMRSPAFLRRRVNMLDIVPHHVGQANPVHRISLWPHIVCHRTTANMNRFIICIIDINIDLIKQLVTVT